MAFGLVMTLTIIHRLSGKSKKSPIFTNWLMPGGSNPYNALYSFEQIEKTSLSCKDSTKTSTAATKDKEDENKPTPRKSVFVHFVCDLKSKTMLAVVIAILAVDFPPIFSRVLCKSEELGISLMDTGVALITLNAGISGAKARPWVKITSLKQWFSELYRSANSVIFPIIVGFLRFCIISELDLQEHPSEWGIHWNFYTTIAVISLLQNLVFRPQYAIFIGLAIIMVYQMSLSHFEIAEYVFFAPRTDFISANREGICSLFGYFGV